MRSRVLVAFLVLLPAAATRAEEPPSRDELLKRLGEHMHKVVDYIDKEDGDEEKIASEMESAFDEADKILKEMKVEGEEARLGVIEESLSKNFPKDLEKWRNFQCEENARGAWAGLLDVHAAEEQFAKDDPDGNGLKDYWTLDLSGLYRLVPAGKKEPLKLIDQEIARMDDSPCLPLDKEGALKLPGAKDELAMAAVPALRMTVGYRFGRVEKREIEAGKWEAIGDASGRSATYYAFCAYPEVYGKTGKMTLLMTGDEHMYFKDLKGEKPAGVPFKPLDEGWREVQGSICDGPFPPLK